MSCKKLNSRKTYGICNHGKRKNDCKECCGSGICDHGKRRRRCIKCGGSGICQHKKVRTDCIECCGSGICHHKRLRRDCIECIGSQICEHRKRRRECVECSGSQICEHSKRRSECVECSGSQICEHKRRKRNCIECKPEIACKLCKSILPGKYKPYCFRCFCYLNPESEVATKYKLKETYIVGKIREKFPELKFVYNKRINGGCSNRMPDLYLDCGTHNLVVEIDENQHSNYSCENKRMMELFKDGGSIPLVVIRFNPDSYEEDDEKQEPCFTYTITGQLRVNSCFEDRFNILCDSIEKCFKEHPKKEITEIKLFYTNF